MNSEQEFWTVREAADLLRCSEKTIVRYIQDRKLIKCSYVGGKWLIPRESLVRLLDENGTKEFKLNSFINRH